MAQGSLIGLSADDLNAIITSAKGCLVANTVRGQSYSIAGRSYTFPDLAACQNLLQEANYALGLLTGARSMNVRANFNLAIGRGRGYVTGPATGQ